jgi:hypothetical protein
VSLMTTICDLAILMYAAIVWFGLRGRLRQILDRPGSGRRAH